MNEKTITIPVPLVAPFGIEITDPQVIENIWDTFVKPGQSDDAPPQSAEMRALMAVLRSVHQGLTDAARTTPV